MQAGQMDRRVIFQRRDATLDSFGTEDQNTWTDVFECAARKSMTGGREYERARLIVADADANYVVRHCGELSSLTEKDRIQDGDLYFDIRFVNDSLKRMGELHFVCTLHR